MTDFKSIEKLVSEYSDQMRYWSDTYQYLQQSVPIDDDIIQKNILIINHCCLVIGEKLMPIILKDEIVEKNIYQIAKEIHSNINRLKTRITQLKKSYPLIRKAIYLYLATLEMQMLKAKTTLMLKLIKRNEEKGLKIIATMTTSNQSSFVHQ